MKYGAVPQLRGARAMREPYDNELLIGVDGGATEVKAHEVLVLSASEGLSLALGAASASSCYDRAEGFEPAPMAAQLVAFERGAIVLAPPERDQGRLWVEAVASSILSVAAQAGRRAARIGMCMPGLKTADGRGIGVLRNGPRMPDFLAQVEARLAQHALTLAQPIARLVSDGHACGLGENTDAHGLLRDVTNAYYVGGGTGVAEALKLDGEIVLLDLLRGWIEKAWQMEWRSGTSFEELVSTRGINAAYAARSGRALPVHEDEFPEQRAARGDAIALAVMAESSEALAELIFARILALRDGPRTVAGAENSATNMASSTSRAKKNAHAPRHLERVVLGQRLGRIFAEQGLRRIFADRVEKALADRLRASGARDLHAQYLEGASLKPDFLVASTLREAPALGAAALALQDARATARTRTSSQEMRG